MADPFSITVGVASLVALAVQTIDTTRTFVHELKHRRETAEQFLEELYVLQLNLSRLDRLLKFDVETARQFVDTSVLVSSTLACRNRLNTLNERLRKARQGRHLNLQSLRWPFEVKEHREAISDLRAFAQWIQFALCVDGCALLSKNSAQLLKALGNQLESFQLLQKMDQQIVSIENYSRESNLILRESHSNAEQDRILNWISNLDHKSKHHDVSRKRVNGTGQWFLHDPVFKIWRDEAGSSVLWCRGIQGSGKSMLLSLAIDHLRESFAGPKVALAYFYFNYQDSDSLSAEVVLRSLLRQVLLSYDRLPEQIRELRQRTESKERSLQLEDVEQALLTAFSGLDHTFLVIDALDECGSEQRRALFAVLWSLAKKVTLKILLTSRPILGSELIETSVAPLQLEIGATDSDLAIYVSKIIQDSDNADEIDDVFKTKIVHKIIQKAQRMFLLAKLQIESVVDRTSAGEMVEALEKMPLGLEEAFEETLKRVRSQPPGKADLGINVLMWLTHARRQMLIADLSYALGIKIGSSSLKSEDCPFPKRMIDCCMGLTVVDERSTVIRLVHYSVQEHLHKHRERIFGKGDEAITEKCLTYLLFEPFAHGPCQLKVKIKDLVAKNPFATYAARYWGDHMRAANTEEFDALALKFLQAKAQRACSYQIYYYTKNFREEYWRAEEAHSVNGLHLAATFGLERLGKQLLEAGQAGVDDLTHMGTTALIKAAAGGHAKFARMLLHKAADPLKENWYGTALHCAAEAGKIETILELVENGTSIDLRDRRGRTSLHCATVSGHVETMKTLLDHGTNVNAVCKKNYTALRYAVVQEQAPVVAQILIEKGADVTIPGNNGVTPLHDAAMMNSEETLLLLLNHEADVNARAAHSDTPLHFAAERNHAIIVRHLIRSGANVHAKTADGVTALYLAAENGGVETVKILIEAGADVEANDNDYLTSLGVAVRENRAAIVPLLLEAGADPEAKDEEGYTPLQVATRKGYTAIAKVLEDAGTKSPSDKIPLSPPQDSFTVSKLEATRTSTMVDLQDLDLEQRPKNNDEWVDESDASSEEDLKLNFSKATVLASSRVRYRGQRRNLARDEKSRRVKDKKSSVAAATAAFSMSSSAPPIEPCVFFCQEKACSYRDLDEDQYKQHMENVHS